MSSGSPPRITTTTSRADAAARGGGGHVVDFDFQIEDIVATAAQAGEDMQANQGGGGSSSSRRGSVLQISDPPVAGGGNGMASESKLRSRITSPTSPTLGTLMESPEESGVITKLRIKRSGEKSGLKFKF